jgi:hypothetical protein
MNVWGARATVVLSVASALALTAIGAYLTLNRLLNAGIGFDSLIAAMGISALAGAAFIVIVGNLAEIIFLLTSRVARLVGLGVNDLELGLLTSVKASRRPLGIAHCWKSYSFLDLRLRARGLFAHSLLYNHPTAIRDMAAWIVRASSAQSS